MIHIEFNENDIEKLNYERYNHPHPRVQLKMEVLYLKSQALCNKDICRINNICKATLCKYLYQYKQGGVEALKEINFYRQQSELSKYKSTIEEYFTENPPVSLKEAAAKIEELTGITRDPSRVGKFLKRIGMQYRKVGTIPAKADVKEQERFKEEELEPRIKEAQEGKRVLFFC
jgi:transposase